MRRKVKPRTQRQENVARNFGYIGVYSGKPEKVQVVSYDPRRLMIVNSVDRESLIRLLVLQMQEQDYCPRGIPAYAAGGDVAGGSRKLPAGNSPSAASRKKLA